MSKHSLLASMEAINFQSNSLLFKELELAFSEYCKLDKPDAKTTKNFCESVNAIVFEYAKMTIDFSISKDDFINAWVFIPPLNKNHPLYIDFFREMTSIREVYKNIRTYGTIFKGGVNKNNSTLIGSFTKLKFEVGVSKGLLESKFLTPGEIAAAVMHELGHIFSYFEFMGQATTTNFILQDISKRLLNSDTTVKKFELLIETKELLDIEIENPEALISSNNETSVQTVILKQMMERQHNELKSNTYDATAWEMLADQFASRHGAGRESVTALDKLYRYANNSSYRTNLPYVLFESLKTALILPGMALSYLTPLLINYYFFVDRSFSLYDKPKSRILRIKRDIINLLKDKNLPKEKSKQIVEDIEVIDKILSDMNERRAFLEFFQNSLFTHSRKQYKQVVFQQDLEMLVNNDLFVKAHKFKTFKV